MGGAHPDVDTTDLVGRGGELLRLAAAFTEGRGIAVVGDAGIGKTSIVRAAAAVAGTRLHEGGCLATLAWTPYLALRRAVGADLEGDATSVATEVERRIGGDLLFIDDYQWADQSTRDVVALLGGRIGLVVTSRPGRDPADDQVAVLAEVGLEVFRLEALPAADAARLARRVRPDLGDQAVDQLVATAGGNPLIVIELGQAGTPTGSLRSAVAARLGRLSPEALAGIQRAVVAARPLESAILGPGADDLIDRGLVIRDKDGLLTIRHVLLADAVAAGMDESRLRELHAELARLSDDPGAAARHYAAAGERAAALHAALAAADATSTPGERADHLAVAASNADGEAADGLRLRAARALVAAGRYAAAEAVLATVSADDPISRATVHLERGRARWYQGDPEAAEREGAMGLALADGSRTEVEVGLRLDRARSLMFTDGDIDGAVAETTRTLRLALETGFSVPRAWMMAGTASGFGGRPGYEEQLERAREEARRAGEHDVECMAANNIVTMQESDGSPARARELAAEMIVRTRSLGLGGWALQFEALLANLDFHAGAYHEVLERTERLDLEGADARTREQVGITRYITLVDLGRGHDVIPRLEAMLTAAATEWTSRSAVLHVLGEAELAGGRSRRAFDLSQELIDGVSELGIAGFGLVTRAWAAFDLGREAPDTTIALPDFRMLQAVPLELDAVRALARGEDEAARAGFDRAADAWAGLHRRGELRCRAAAGEAARRLGHADDAMARLLDAEHACEAIGLVPTLGRIRRSLRLLGIARSAPHVSSGSLLTRRERESLELVGRGLTTAGIARRMGIGRGTVDQILGSATRKLGATSRVHAAAGLESRRSARVIAVRDEATAGEAVLGALEGADVVLDPTTDPVIAERVADDLRRLGRTTSTGEPEPRPPALGADELAILEQLAAGLSLGEASARLHLSRRTADRRLAAARRALDVATTAEALIAFRRLDPGPRAD